ncbi:patatin-like phospholipase family protein [Halomarina halobia]|uniref:Patatin-like phospholipase family protein n=1 Tax=Halomarina halobia TaxID=3033386 RepID=A0ABD6A7W6_9EURY|nr:patatin-like phospholipase family protein [Halomarina sp. PSR21]
MSDDDPTKVAIACQGGGSHTAFTAGVLRRLLRERPSDVEIVGLSGTSGGAICALAAWYGLLTGGEGRAAELLESIWDDLAADGVPERTANALLVWTSRALESGLPIPQFSPYHAPTAAIGRGRLRDVLEAHVRFDRLPALVDATSPTLLIGTVDVNDGEFKTIVNEGITADAVLASAAVPSLFEAVRLERTAPHLDPDVYDGDLHWDGLFSQNPPIREFLDVPNVAEEKPDEIWIVRINPKERRGEPTSLEEIADRRNELAGNLSLEQEVAFIEQVNEWLRADPPKLRGEYKPIEIRWIALEERLPTASKLDRRPSFLRDLMEGGDAQARRFLSRR